MQRAHASRRATGRTPSFRFEVHAAGDVHPPHCRADGRGRWCEVWRLESRQTRHAMCAGVLIEARPRRGVQYRRFNPFTSRMALMFPQGDGRARFYFGARSTEPGMAGAKDIPRFIEESVKVGMPQEYFEGAKTAGPLATFSGADSWTDHPYRDGVALIGDAAAQSDTWDQGCDTMRDVRILRDALLRKRMGCAGTYASAIPFYSLYQVMCSRALQWNRGRSRALLAKALPPSRLNQR